MGCFFYQHGLSLIPAWIIFVIECGKKLHIYSRTSTFALWLLIHTGLKLIYNSKSDPGRQQPWYWLCKLARSLSSWGVSKTFAVLVSNDHITYKFLIYFQNNSAINGIYTDILYHMTFCVLVHWFRESCSNAGCFRDSIWSNPCFGNLTYCVIISCKVNLMKILKWRCH